MLSEELPPGIHSASEPKTNSQFLSDFFPHSRLTLFWHGTLLSSEWSSIGSLLHSFDEELKHDFFVILGSTQKLIEEIHEIPKTIVIHVNLLELVNTTSVAAIRNWKQSEFRECL
jgi:hypothetical protein